MIDLQDDDKCDEVIRRELAQADVPAVEGVIAHKGSAVPYTVIGHVVTARGEWRIQRHSKSWVAYTLEGMGVPMEEAVKLNRDCLHTIIAGGRHTRLALVRAMSSQRTVDRYRITSDLDFKYFIKFLRALPPAR